MNIRTSALAVLVSVAGLVISSSAHAMTLVPGDFYTSDPDSNVITHLNSSGSLVDTYTLNPTFGTGFQGLSFGPNGLLYAVTDKGSSGFGVIAIDGSGIVQQTYGGSEVIGNISSGKIGFGPGGNFYVANQDKLIAFTQGNPTGSVIYSTNQVFDVKVLPTGNLLVVSAYNLDEITSSGTFVRNILSGITLTDARGVEYDAATNKIFVSMLGDSGEPFRIMRVNGTTGAVETSTSFIYADDLQRTSDGRIVAGSRTQTPGIFDQNLNQIGTLGSQQQIFVTQMSTVPEPATLIVLGLGAVALLRRGKK